MLGLHCCKAFSLVLASGGYSLVGENRGYTLVVVCELLIGVPSLVAEQRLQALRLQ